METKELLIGTPEVEQGEVQDIGRLGSYCTLAVQPGARSIPIVVTPLNTHRRFASFGIQGRSSMEQNSITAEVVGGKPFNSFPRIPVQWSGTTPRTRQEPRDNFRVLQFDRNGSLRQVEIGVATRGKRIFLTVQWQFWGIVVPNNGSTPTVAPTLEHFSYPGFAGYNEQWPGVLPHIQRWAAEWGIKPEGRPSKVKWNPGQNPFGDEGAAVLFFSPVGGTGRLLSARGVAHFLSSGKLLEEEVLFLHFSDLDPEANKQVGVEPMSWVRVGEIKPPRDGATLRQATRVTIN